MSKFDKYKKKGEDYYVYPHKHCQKCGQMIEESLIYCPDCYKIIQEKKAKKRRFRKKESSDQDKIIEKNEGN